MTSGSDRFRPTVMVVFGTRPEAIKVAPVIRLLQQADDVRVVTVVTAQHREMLDQVNRIFGILPDVDLNVMSHGQTLNSLAATVMIKMDDVYSQFEPDAVLVQGDTTTVMASAIAAFNREIPVLHLEAGLRSGDLRSPFPEEANRKLVSQIAAMHFAPTVQAKTNLLDDGIDPESILVTGNTVIDAFQWAAEQDVPVSDSRLADVPPHTRVVLLTAHRRENLGEPMEQVGRAIRELAARHPDVAFVWAAHKNPAVRAAIAPHFDGVGNVLPIEPVNYDEFAGLIARSDIVLTDSGGIQEEAPSLGKPVLVLRTNTERPEAVSAGTVKLIGTDTNRIVDEVSRLLRSPDAYAEMSNAVNPYGDGNAAKRVVAGIRSAFLDGPPVPDYVGDTVQGCSPLETV